MSEQQIIHAGCLCGAVRFSANLPSKWCAHCHCKMCQRAHGAGYVTWVGFESGQVKLETGGQHLQWYESSSGARRGFCNTCGSTMMFESERWPGETHIALACIEDTIDREPQANVFYDSHVNWMPIDEALKVFNG